jgi:hypothetical protein
MRYVTSCGETDERVAAALHGAVAVIYVLMLVWHGASALKHWARHP